MTDPQTIAVTGATGFVGSTVLRALRERGHDVVAWSRAANGFELQFADAEASSVAERWRAMLEGVDVVVHCAARVHQMNEGPQQAALHEQCNANATQLLARAAAQAGVRRFVFVSTAKVYGEGAHFAYREDMEPAPQGPYAGSKWHAERLLRAIGEEGALEIVVVRPPLVYGDGVGGNFRTLWRIAGAPLPLPLASVRNRRDMIAVDNLAQVIALCCESAAAAGETFNVADAQPYSLADIIANIRTARRRPADLWALPLPILRWVVTLLRGADDAQRLLGDFLLDTRRVQRVTGWTPQLHMRDVAAAMAEKPAC